MAETGFQIEVPITLKGGNEGEKVGRQIGEKIASQLNKSFKVIGLGKEGKTDIAGLTGFVKGFKPIAKTLGIVAGAITAAVAVLAQSSPYLKGILSIFGRAFMIFFRPFGDFLATLLRPLAILMMKMAVAFLKWTRPIQGKVGEAVAGAPQIPTTGTLLPDIAIGIANWALKLGAAIGAIILEIGKAAFNLGTQIGEWLLNKVIIPAGNWISEKLLGAWDWIKDIGTKIWDIIKTPFESIRDSLNSVIQWILKLIPGTQPGEEKGKTSSTSNSTSSSTSGKSLQSIIGGIWTDKGWFKDFASSLAGGATQSKAPGFQTGTPFVPGDGLYKLHRGEQVIPRNQTNKSVIFKPTFQITTGGSSEVDVDEMARRAGRMVETELKKRGII